jgi:uncharacterized membrane protein
MSRLVVIAFKDDTSAKQMRRALAYLRKPQLINLAEPIIVVHEPDGKLRVKPTIPLAGVMALFGAFWGVMVGLLLSMPWLGLGIGAAAGAIVGGVADIGVEDKLVKEVGAAIEPGHSALLLFAHDWTSDRVLEREVAEFDGFILPTSLSHELKTGLRPAFSSEE